MDWITTVLNHSQVKLPKPGIFFIKKSLEYNVKFLLIVALDAEIAHYDFQSQLSTALRCSLWILQ
jgi:hypothetical protein